MPNVCSRNVSLRIVTIVSGISVINNCSLFLYLQEYSLKQLQALVQSGVGTRINKKSRQKLFAIIEERDRLR